MLLRISAHTALPLRDATSSSSSQSAASAPAGGSVRKAPRMMNPALGSLKRRSADAALLSNSPCAKVDMTGVAPFSPEEMHEFREMIDHVLAWDIKETSAKSDASEISQLCREMESITIDQKK